MLINYVTLMEIRNWTGCSQFRSSVTDRFRHLENSAGILTDGIGVKNGESRLRRGILNFVGETSKIVFDTPDETTPNITTNRKRNPRSCTMVTPLFCKFLLY